MRCIVAPGRIGAIYSFCVRYGQTCHRVASAFPSGRQWETRWYAIESSAGFVRW